MGSHNGSSIFFFRKFLEEIGLITEHIRTKAISGQVNESAAGCLRLPRRLFAVNSLGGGFFEGRVRGKMASLIFLFLSQESPGSLSGFQ